MSSRPYDEETSACCQDIGGAAPEAAAVAAVGVLGPKSSWRASLAPCRVRAGEGVARAVDAVDMNEPPARDGGPVAHTADVAGKGPGDVRARERRTCAYAASQ